MMTKKTIKYTDYNGIPREEDFFFNLTKAEVIEMEYGDSRSFVDHITKISKSNDIPGIMNELKDLVLKAYGEKSDDGKYFRKSKEISSAFSQTEAYSELMTYLLANPEACGKFIFSIMPGTTKEQSASFDAGLKKEIAKAEKIKPIAASYIDDDPIVQDGWNGLDHDETDDENM